jgi:tripartite-type tricarboxylate transporter receptor subunit TctC
VNHFKANTGKLNYAMPALLQNAKAGKVRPIAVGTTARSPAVPDVPTVAEQGYPGFNAALWLGIMGPAGASLLGA